jgi:hypothetical protein
MVSMMKNKYLFGYLLLLLMMLSFWGCDPVTDDGSFVDPITLYEKVGGKWNLTDIRQVDEIAKAAGISPNEMGLYAQFSFGSLSIELNTEDNQPGSYQVTGDAPELFPNNGFWQLDTEFPYANGTAPKILLYSDAAKTTKIGELSITSVPGAKQEMELRLTRTAKGVPFVSYVYSLKK